MSVFRPICQIDDIPVDSGLARQFDGHWIALFRNSEGRVFAYADSCPHRQHPIHKGDVRAGVITCASHAWRFLLTSGRSLINPAVALTAYRVRVRGDIVEIAASADDPAR